MRPKIVILTLVVALVLIGIMVVLKGVMAGHSGNAGGQTPAVEASVESPTAATNVQVVEVVQVNPDSSNTAAISEQTRAAAIENELDQIRKLLREADGENNPRIISALIGKVENPEAEVRSAALDALKELNDTNAVPGLQQAVELIKDPRAKVAVLDTIDYINLPSVTQNVPPELATNYNTQVDRNSTSTNIQFNPAFLKGNKNIRMRNNGQQTAPPNAPADQPQ
jgi:hypothetical protein